MDENRRSFLKKASSAALGLGCGFPLLSAGCSGSNHHAEEEVPSENQWAMVVDIRKCLDEKVREACIEACGKQHNLPDNPQPDRKARKIQWIWKERYNDAFPDQKRWHTEDALKKKYDYEVGHKDEPLPVLVLCNHCTSPACVKVCPTAATWKRSEDGIVMMDMHRCIGCRYCVVACPYGARSFNWFDVRRETPTDYPERSRGVVEKCTFCTERIREGLAPYCVEAADQVPGGKGALTFGKLGDPKIKDILEHQYTICRMIGLGTRPNVYYIV